MGVNEETVRNNDFVSEFEAETDFSTLKWLDIAEVNLLKNYS